MFRAGLLKDGFKHHAANRNGATEMTIPSREFSQDLVGSKALVGETMSVGILMPTRNCLMYTRAALQSIKTMHYHSLLIVDDGSTDGSREWFERTGINWLDGASTPSLASKWNLGIEFLCTIGVDFVLVTNNDVLLAPVTIDGLVGRMMRRDVWLASSVNMKSQLSDPNLILAYIVQDDVDSQSPDFSCFLINRECWENVGPFDENFSPCYFEDNDYHHRIKLLGGQAISTFLAPYYHYGSITQNSVPGGVCKARQFERNREYFKNKWGFIP